MLPASALLTVSVLVLASFSAGLLPSLQAASGPSFTFAVAGDFSSGSQAVAVSSLWGETAPSLSIGAGDLSYANLPPLIWCSGIWSVAVGTHDGFLMVGDHDTYYNDRLTNDLPYGYWENVTGYANSCGLKGTGVNWFGSGTVSDNLACNKGSDLSVFDTCFGREMYVDYPPSSPLVRFIVLCDGIPSYPNATAWCDYGSSGTDAANHFTWLDNTITQARESGIRWIVVLNHDHSWAAGPYGITYSSDLWNHLIADKVDVFISGEEHNYQRSYPLICPTLDHDWYQNQNGSDAVACIGNSSKNTYLHGQGLLYLISGTGGQVLNKFNRTNIDWVSNSGYFAALNDTTWGFNLFNVTSTSLSARFIPAVGSFTDNWTIDYPSVVGGTVVELNGLALIVPFEVTLVASVACVAVIIYYRRKTRVDSDLPVTSAQSAASNQPDRRIISLP